MTNLERAYAADITIRMADERYPAEGVRVIADEFATGGVVYDKDDVRVTAFDIDSSRKRARPMEDRSCVRANAR